MTAVILKDLELSLLISVVAKRCIAFRRRMNMHPHTKWIDELKVTSQIPVYITKGPEHTLLWKKISIIALCIHNEFC